MAPDPPRRGTGRALLGKAIRLIIITAIIYFAAHTFFATTATLPAWSGQVQPYTLALSFIVLIIALIGYPIAWRAILMTMHGPLSFPDAFYIWFLSNLGRYVPGKVWQVVGRAEFAKAHGFPRRITVSSFIYETLFLLLSGIFICFAANAFPLPLLAKMPPLAALAGFAIVLAILLYPRLFAATINFVLRQLKREDITVTLAGPQAAKLFCFYLLLWLIQGCAFYLFVFSFTGIHFTYLPALIFIFTSCWVIGYLSFITPGGLGVREGLMYIALAQFLPPEAALFIPLAARLWITVGEAVLLGAAGCGRTPGMRSCR